VTVIVTRKETGSERTTDLLVITPVIGKISPSEAKAK
jgi:hypothetical protein